MKLKPPIILFFINGPVPNEEQVKTALTCGLNVRFRNALNVPNEGSLEDCDGVAGDVPVRYADKYPTAEEVFENFFSTASTNAQKANFKPAPVTQAQKPAPEWKPNN